MGLHKSSFATVAGIALATTALTGAFHALASPAPALVTGTVSDATVVPLAAAVPAAMSDAVDGGALQSTMSLDHVQVVLKRSAARQAALDALVVAQTDPSSPEYHRWLTPAELAAGYGPAAADIDATATWLTSHGLRVNRISPTGMSIDVSGTVAALNGAFHTALHAYTRNGESHLAPAVVPAMPAALAPVVDGPVLSNFFPRPLSVPARAIPSTLLAKAKVSRIGTGYTMTVSGTTYYAVTPTDFATIYDLGQARSGYLGPKLTGTGRTVVVAEQTDINPADWNTFRSTFGLTAYKGTLSITHPGGCADPGFTVADETEAAIDSEWSSAVAPAATIVEAACAGTATTFGVQTTLQNLVELGTDADAISISYGGAEQQNGLTFIDGFTNLLEEGASEGIPIFVSSGDGAADTADEGAIGTNGLSVNGLASSPYDTAVGGTDFLDTALRENATYWSSTNTSTGGSVKSYVPEIPWDNSCSNSVIDKFVGAGGPILACNHPAPANFSYQNTVGGGGGQSLIFAKPSFQTTSLLGVPNDGVRDLPDISLFAANGIWNHFYLECQSNTATGGVPCDFANPTDFLGSAYGGTSFGAPDFAGIAALIAEYSGFRVGNLAPRLYQIATLQYTNSVLAGSCLATKGNAISPACVFYDETVGDNSVPCEAGTRQCATNKNATAGIGVLSATLSAKAPSFPATNGYDLATGLGSVNITNLIANFPLEN